MDNRIIWLRVEHPAISPLNNMRQLLVQHPKAEARTEKFLVVLSPKVRGLYSLKVASKFRLLGLWDKLHRRSRVRFPLGAPKLIKDLNARSVTGRCNG